MRNKIIGLCMIAAGSGVFVYFIRLGLCHWPFGLDHALVVLAACLGVAAVITGSYLIASRIPALREHPRAIRRCLLTLFFIASVGLAYYYGTTLTPVLLLIGFAPLQIVPAVLLSELFTGFLAGFTHHAMGNVTLLPKTMRYRPTRRRFTARLTAPVQSMKT